jgi:hypothetical protein
MSLQKRIATLLTFSLLFLIAVTSASAQGDPPKPAEANYEAVLHVLVSGNQAGQGDALPNALGSVSRQIRTEFGSGNLRLINTYLGRLSNMGNLEYKGVSSAYAQELPGSPSFLDWRLSGLRNMQNAAGQPVHYLQGFRFGARVPVRMGNFHDEKAPVAINYEAIGLTVDRMSVRENVPTLIGTLTQPKTDGTLFLILTVRNVDK